MRMDGAIRVGERRARTGATATIHLDAGRAAQANGATGAFVVCPSAAVRRCVDESPAGCNNTRRQIIAAAQ